MKFFSLLLKKAIFSFLTLFSVALVVNAQSVAINSDGSNPDASAMLEIVASDKGLLIPRVALNDASTAAPVTSPADGLLIFNSSGTEPDGFYYWDDTNAKWKLLYSGDVPTVPGNVEYWIKPTGESYIRPQHNSNARVYDAGENFGYLYEGTNDHGAFFAGDDVGVVGHRAGTSSAELPTFIADEYPFFDTNADENVTSDDDVTVTGVYGYGNLYVGVTGIASWDAGVRGVSLDDAGGTNAVWPLAGVIGEVVYDDGGDYGQQGVYGWQAASAGNGDYCSGILGRTSQTGLQSAGVAGYYTATVGTPSSFSSSTSFGFLGHSAYGAYGQINGATNFGGAFYNLNSSGTGMAAAGNNEIASYLTDGSGGAFTSDNIAVYGKVTSTGNGTAGAYFSHEADGGHYTYIAYYRDELSDTYYDIYGTGSNAKKMKGETKNSYVTMFTPISTEIVVEDMGTGKLKNGNAYIRFDPVFTKNIYVDNKHPLKVFIQLEGDCKGVYVTNKSQEGFEVKELQNGSSNVAFAWSATASRADITDSKGKIISKHVGVRFPSAPEGLQEMTIDISEKDTEKRNTAIRQKDK